MTRRPDGETASGAAWRDLLAQEAPKAHEALLTLFGQVAAGDAAGVTTALEQLVGVGARLDCPELTEWCLAADAGSGVCAQSLPQLLAIWERAQRSVITRAYVDEGCAGDDLPPLGRIQL